MLTLKQLHEKLQTLLTENPEFSDTPVVLADCRSGVNDWISGPQIQEWTEQDNDYGVDLPVDTKVCFLYVG